MSISCDELILQSLFKVLQLDLLLLILLGCSHIMSVAYGTLCQKLLIVIQCSIVAQLVAVVVVVAGVIRVGTVRGFLKFRFTDFLATW